MILSGMPLDPAALSVADAYLVVAQLSYRADVTRRVPPTLHRLLEQHGNFGPHEPDHLMEWVDQRIAYANAHATVPDPGQQFLRQVRHTVADAFLTVEQLAYRGGQRDNEPALLFLVQRHGAFGGRGAQFMLDWTDQRIRESGLRLRDGLWS